MIGSRKVRCLKVGKNTAVFIDSQRLIDVLKDLELLPWGWQPGKRVRRDVTTIDCKEHNTQANG